MKFRKLLLLPWLTISLLRLVWTKSSIYFVIIGYNFLGLYRLDELTAKINDYAPDDADLKSPSPEPIYDKDGKRINTR